MSTDVNDGYFDAGIRNQRLRWLVFSLEQLIRVSTDVNGGYFDNPELRYGVTCYGEKPSKENHDIMNSSMATPTSPDALEFDKKVADFKLEADTIGIMPFNSNKW